jgi:hypothetical protein
MAFAVVVLMGIMAVAIDGGRIYTLRRDAQNAADAAALQGAKAVCQDEDFEAVALDVAAMNGFSGAGVVEVNNPPLYSDSPINDDQVEVVITATIQGGMIAPVVYEGELNTRVRAVGDCIRGTLKGSGAAIFAGCTSLSGDAVSVTGSGVRVIGGIHSNGNVKAGGNASNPATITGTVTYVGTDKIQYSTTTLFPATDNPVHVTPKEYPLDTEVFNYDAFRPGGWAYEAVYEVDPNLIHYSEPKITKNVLQSEGWLSGDNMAKGVYVSPNGFQFNASDDLIGDDVTFVSKYGKMAFNGGTSQFRPYFGGLLVVTEGNYDAGQCDSNWTVSITGNVNWGGIIFAPNGRVSMSASTGSTFYGSIVAGSVDLSGSNLMVIFDPSFLPPDPDTIELGE